MLEFSNARKTVRPLQPKQTGWTGRRSLRLPAQPPAQSRPRSAPGPQPLLDPAAITHTKTPCVSALGDGQQVAGTVPEQGRESTLAPNPLVPHAQHIFHGKAIPLFPGLNMGVPSAAHNAHPPPKSTARSRRTRKGRTGRSAEVCFVARRRGQAPQCPTPGPPHLPGCRTRGVLHNPLTSSPVHHLFGAPLGHGLHGKRLHCPLG